MTALAMLILGACRGPLLDLHAEAPARVWAAAPVCAEVAVKAVGLGLLTAAIDQIIGIIARVERDQREERRRK